MKVMTNYDRPRGWKMSREESGNYQNKVKRKSAYEKISL